MRRKRVRQSDDEQIEVDEKERGMVMEWNRHAQVVVMVMTQL